MAYRIEVVEATDPRAEQALTAYLNEMAERVDARWLQDDLAVNPTDFFVVALDDHDRVVGCGGLRQVEPGVGEIHRMWVNPVLRGQGIGRRVLSALEGAAAVSGCEVLQLGTPEALVEAVLLYETSGFQRMLLDDDTVDDGDMRYYQKAL